MQSFGRMFIGILSLIIVIFLISQLVVGVYSEVNAGMQPELQAGDRLLINRMAYRFTEPTRGTIIEYKTPGSGTSQLKRIIGLPGDIIEIKNGVVYVNGIKLEEPYVNSSSPFNLSPYQVPLGSFFVLQDNRTYNNFSPGSCTIPQKDITGRAWILAWPPDRLGKVDRYPLDSELTQAQTP